MDLKPSHVQLLIFICYLNDFDQLLLDVPLDHDGPGVGVGEELQGGVDSDLAVHREEPVDGVGQINFVHVR